MIALTTRDKPTKSSARARRLLLVTAAALCLPAWAASHRRRTELHRRAVGRRAPARHRTGRRRRALPSRVRAADQPGDHLSRPRREQQPDSEPALQHDLSQRRRDAHQPHSHRLLAALPDSRPSANYHSLTERYLTDVAADSGRVANPYAVDTQYTDSTSAHIQYNSTYAGALTDTTAYPVGGRRLQQPERVNRLPDLDPAGHRARQLHPGQQPPPRRHDLYFLVMPEKVQTCFDDFTDCGPYGGITDTKGNFSEYCAYHSSFNISGHGSTLWANMPDGPTADATSSARLRTTTAPTP